MASERPATGPLASHIGRPREPVTNDCPNKIPRLLDAIKKIQKRVEETILSELATRDPGCYYGRIDLTVFVTASELTQFNLVRNTSEKLN